eukprot:TRINITY_DN16133_c0_g1_i1.p2 TRINITY_DN16133_c0_g1~~TRINITY_DN16133_c0_g1_i1.p2  ORF type:complete len:523 (+),score=230.71 TRINITY_DN16133_c0_g1_i1:2330-3898(+)
MSKYDADAVFKDLDRMFEEGCSADDVRSTVEELKQYVGSFSEELALVKKARGGLSKVTKEIEKLDVEVADLQEKYKKMMDMTADEAEEVKTLATGLRQPVAKQCERVRLLRSEADPPNPFKLSKCIHEITRDREKEILIATKQLRELKMILKMMKQHEEELEVESTNQINEKTAEKDRDIFNLAMKCVKEREQFLEDVKAIKMDIDAIEEHLRTGHYEYKAKKEAKLKDYNAKIQREYKTPGGVNQVFDNPEEKGPEPASRSECTFTKVNPNDPTGLTFEDKTRLTQVQPNTPAEKAGLAKFIGRRVTHCNGNEIRPGYIMKLSGLKTITLRFDMDVENLRCSYLKNEDDDPIFAFSQKEVKYKEGYKKMEDETNRMRDKTREEKKALEAQKKKLKDYEQKVALEKAEKEREIKQLQHKLSVARLKQTEYELESKKLFSWMTQSQRTLEAIRGKTKAQGKALGNGPERKAIKGRPKSKSPAAHGEEEPTLPEDDESPAPADADAPDAPEAETAAPEVTPDEE